MWVGVGAFVGVMMPSPANANESELLQAQRLREAGSNQTPTLGLGPQSIDQPTHLFLGPK